MQENTLATKADSEANQLIDRLTSLLSLANETSTLSISLERRLFGVSEEGCSINEPPQPPKEEGLFHRANHIINDIMQTLQKTTERLDKTNVKCTN